jgi:hypothetical protein
MDKKSLRIGAITLAAAGAMGAMITTSAEAAGIPGGVSGVSWAGSNESASGLGGSFAFLNSGGVSPFLSANPWTQTWYIPDTVYSATFGGTGYSNSNDAGNIIYFGLPDTTTYGQTFYAPGGTLTNWQFDIANNPTVGNADFVVATWDGSRAVSPLFSERLSIAAGQSWVNSGPLNLSLTTGTEYVAFLTVGSVPEPSTWAMMMLGFAGLRFAGYRKAKTSVALTA